MMDKVTGIQEVRNGYMITVNGAETFHLSAAEYRSYPLGLDEAFDFEAYKHNLLISQYPEALNRTVALLASRARSRHEVEQKLTDKGYLADTVEMVIYKLEKEGFLNDAAFATAWVEARSARGLGKARLLQELRQKGVDSDNIHAALDSLDEETQDAQTVQFAAKVLRRYAKLDAKETMQKSIAAMLRRGYGYGEASRALQAAIEQEMEQEP